MLPAGQQRSDFRKTTVVRKLQEFLGFLGREDGIPNRKQHTLAHLARNPL